MWKSSGCSATRTTATSTSRSSSPNSRKTGPSPSATGARARRSPEPPGSPDIHRPPTTDHRRRCRCDRPHRGSSKRHGGRSLKTEPRGQSDTPATLVAHACGCGSASSPSLGCVAWIASAFRTRAQAQPAGPVRHKRARRVARGQRESELAARPATARSSAATSSGRSHTIMWPAPGTTVSDDLGTNAAISRLRRSGVVRS